MAKWLVTVAVATSAALALLLTRVVGFPVQTIVGTGFGAVLLLWTAAVGESAAASEVLPRRLTRAARIIGAAGLGGMAAAAAGAALPKGSRAQYAVAGPGVVLTVGGFLALPLWALALSRTMSRRPSVVDHSQAAAWS